MGGSSALSSPRIVPVTSLFRVGPNPVRIRLLIEFASALDSKVSLDVVDVSGRQVRSLARGLPIAGSRQFIWELDDDGGRPVASGVYFCRLKTDSGVKLQKVVVQK
jgi:hypothetical protein